jgi:hypothetical protein
MQVTGPGWARPNATFEGGDLVIPRLRDNSRVVYKLMPNNTLEAFWSLGRLSDRATMRRMKE